MKTGIPEIDEMTLRVIENLPFADLAVAPGNRLVVVEITALLENNMFDGVYSAIIYLGDFGLYRVSEIRTHLVLSSNSRQ